MIRTSKYYPQALSSRLLHGPRALIEQVEENPYFGRHDQVAVNPGLISLARLVIAPVISFLSLDPIVPVPDPAPSTRGSPRAAPVNPLKSSYGHSRHPFLS